MTQWQIQRIRNKLRTAPSFNSALMKRKRCENVGAASCSVFRLDQVREDKSLPYPLLWGCLKRSTDFRHAVFTMTCPDGACLSESIALPWDCAEYNHMVVAKTILHTNVVHRALLRHIHTTCPDLMLPYTICGEWLLMPKVECVESIRVSKKWTPMQVDCVMTEFFFKLGKLHSFDVAHKDIKPGNLVVDKDGKIRLIDWDGSLFVQNLPLPSTKFSIHKVLTVLLPKASTPESEYFRRMREWLYLSRDERSMYSITPSYSCPAVVMTLLEKSKKRKAPQSEEIHLRSQPVGIKSVQLKSVLPLRNVPPIPVKGVSSIPLKTVQNPHTKFNSKYLRWHMPHLPHIPQKPCFAKTRASGGVASPVENSKDTLMTPDHKVVENKYSLWDIAFAWPKKLDVFSLGITWLHMLNLIDFGALGGATRQAVWRNLLLTLAGFIKPTVKFPCGNAVTLAELEHAWNDVTPGKTKVRQAIEERHLLRHLLTWDITERQDASSLCAIFSQTTKLDSALFSRVQFPCQPLAVETPDSKFAIEVSDHARRWTVLQQAFDLIVTFWMHYHTWFLAVSIFDRFCLSIDSPLLDRIGKPLVSEPGERSDIQTEMQTTSQDEIQTAQDEMQTDESMSRHDALLTLTGGMESGKRHSLVMLCSLLLASSLCQDTAGVKYLIRSFPEFKSDLLESVKSLICETLSSKLWMPTLFGAVLLRLSEHKASGFGSLEESHPKVESAFATGGSSCSTLASESTSTFTSESTSTSTSTSTCTSTSTSTSESTSGATAADGSGLSRVFSLVEAERAVFEAVKFMFTGLYLFRPLEACVDACFILARTSDAPLAAIASIGGLRAMFSKDMHSNFFRQDFIPPS